MESLRVNTLWCVMGYDVNKEKLLHIASWEAANHDVIHIVELLIACGVDVNHRMNKWTALMQLIDDVDTEPRIISSAQVADLLQRNGARLTEDDLDLMFRRLEARLVWTKTTKMW